MTTCQSADLRVCVELRGFEPLTPSMRTERATWQSCCRGTFLHVRGIQPRHGDPFSPRLTASRRSHSAPRIGNSSCVLLPTVKEAGEVTPKEFYQPIIADQPRLIIDTPRDVPAC